MTTQRKVLIVDDDPVVGRSFDRVLTRRGYAVVTASDGAEALRKIAAEEYDLVYTDIRMPGMDGIAVAEHIRQQQPWLPVVIVSGYATAENEARAKAAGVSAVLHKPLSPEMIEDSARSALLTEPVTVPEAAPAADPVAAAPIAPVWGAGRRLGFTLGASLVGLAYALALPIAGLVMLVAYPFWAGYRAFAKRTGGFGTWARHVGPFLAAPLIGLVYALALPFVGLGMLAWMGIRALRNRNRAA